MLRQAGEDFADGVGQGRDAGHLAIHAAYFAAMGADGRGLKWREQRVDAFQRTSADKGHRAVKLVRKLFQRTQQLGRDFDAIRRARQIQQSAVNIQ